MGFSSAAKLLPYVVTFGAGVLALSACSRGGRGHRPHWDNAEETIPREGERTAQARAPGAVPRPGDALGGTQKQGPDARPPENAKLDSKGVTVPGNSRQDSPSSAEAEIVEKFNLAYAPGSERALDVYHPAGVRQAPIVFMVHGGAWRLGDKGAAQVVQNKMRHWVSRGYVFVSTNYRLADATPLEQARDVALAMAFVQKNADSFHGDAQRMVLVGHSSGAHLVALLASDPSYRADAGLRPWLGTIALDSAAYDVTAIMKRRHYPFYDRAFGTDPRLWEKSSPLLQLRSAPAPFLAVCSSLRSDSCPQARAFIEKAKALGGQAELLSIAKSHRDINGDLGAPGDYTRDVDAFLASLGL